MKKLITIILLATIVISAASCNYMNDGLFFDVRTTTGNLVGNFENIDISESEKMATKMFPQIIHYSEITADKTMSINIGCPYIDDKLIFTYYDSFNYHGNHVRSYEIKDSDITGTLDYIPGENMIMSYIASEINTGDGKKVYSAQKENDCYKIAKETLDCLYPDNYFELDIEKTNDFNFSANGRYYYFVFVEQIDNVEICSVEMRISVDGQVLFIGNYDFFARKLMKNKNIHDLSEAEEKAETVLKEKLTDNNINLKLTKKQLEVGGNNQLLLLVTYEVIDQYEICSGHISVYVFL